MKILSARLRTPAGLVLLLLALAALASLPFTLMLAFAAPMLLDAPRSPCDPGRAISFVVVLLSPAVAAALVATSARTLLKYSPRGLVLSLALAAVWLLLLWLLKQVAS